MAALVTVDDQREANRQIGMRGRIRAAMSGNRGCPSEAMARK
jgi:hypothetical protein